ncbi:MAG: multiubiquitin domain-containing protein [Nitrospira sp.]|nr:multiubiquitin domain-containing protein [Nitrospira sp.]MCY3955555.1 multiubiquitin domain-containing protein [Nitrospira sp.]MCY4131590.1 multiubiquitin domain-containing protein [Nitrospira sp.]
MSKQNPDGSFELEVNGAVITFKDPVPTASQILREGRFTPTDEHILIRLQKGSSNALGLDESVDLRNGESAKFDRRRMEQSCSATSARTGKFGSTEMAPTN